MMSLSFEYLVLRREDFRRACRKARMVEKRINQPNCVAKVSNIICSREIKPSSKTIVNTQCSICTARANAKLGDDGTRPENMKIGT